MMDKLRVLIASEYQIVRSSLSYMITSAPRFEVAGEVDVSKPIAEEVQQLPFEVALAEISHTNLNRLPGILQLLQRQPRPPVVVLTPHENPSHVRSMLALGVMGYVLKRAAESELLLALERACHGQRYIDPTLSDSIAELVLGDSASSKHSSRPKLSGRETQILRAIAQGFTSQEIAREFGLSVKTVGTYRSRIYEKLGLKTRADLVHYAIAVGLLTGASQA